MPRPALELADILRAHGEAFRQAHAGRLSLGQLKVMSAIAACRTAELGGHVARCDDCQRLAVSYNSCRNRHCPKCQGAAARAWLAEREADLLPAQYFHVVFTLPAPLAVITFQNKAVVYDLLFKAAAETLTAIAADPKHLGARIGLIAVLHSWGSALPHHPHVHCIVPGGGLSPDGDRPELHTCRCRAWPFAPEMVADADAATVRDSASGVSRAATEATCGPRLSRSEHAVIRWRPAAGFDRGNSHPGPSMAKLATGAANLPGCSRGPLCDVLEACVEEGVAPQADSTTTPDSRPSRGAAARAL